MTQSLIGTPSILLRCSDPPAVPGSAGSAGSASVAERADECRGNPLPAERFREPEAQQKRPSPGPGAQRSHASGVWAVWAVASPRGLSHATTPSWRSRPSQACTMTLKASRYPRSTSLVLQTSTLLKHHIRSWIMNYCSPPVCDFLELIPSARRERCLARPHHLQPAKAELLA